MTEQRSRVQARKNKENRKNRKTRKKRSILGCLFKSVLAILLIGTLSVAGVAIYWLQDTPELTEEDLLGSHGSTLVDQNGNEFYTLGGSERKEITYDEIPKQLEAAVLAIEDQRFYDHPGIDVIRIMGAVVANIKDGFGAQGGSTITQQLVKLSVFSTTEKDQTLKRKVQEAWLSLQLERQYSKEQILTMYINKVYMSDNIYGMGTASEYYYGKPASELEIHEAALIAGLPQLPNQYNPYLYPEEAKKRRDLVIDQMVDAGYLSKEQAQEATSQPIDAGLQERDFKDGPNLVIDSYVKEVVEEVQEKTDIDPYTAGATIHTNIDLDAQNHVYQVLNSDDYINYPDNDYQAAVTVVDVKTGQVKAIGGGRNVEDAMGYNRATELDRSIGSTMKPLSVYGPIIEYNKLSTYHQVTDEPYEFPTGDKLENVDNSYMGTISMRTSLVQSRNITTAKFLEEVGLQKSEEFLKQIGIDDLNDGNGLYWSNAIGGEVTPYQLAASYAAFGNNGRYTDPYTVSQITARNGEVIDLRPETVQAMSDYTAYMVTDMLKDAAKSYQQVNPLTAMGIPHAGKTGTTNYHENDRIANNIPSTAFPDRWHAGYTSDYSVAVWTGYDYQLEEGNWLSYNNESGWNALKIYTAIMLHLVENSQATNADWQQPSSVIAYNIVNGSNPPKEATGYGPGTVRELFVKGNEPGNYTIDDLADRNYVDESSESESEESSDSHSSDLESNNPDSNQESSQLPGIDPLPPSVESSLTPQVPDTPVQEQPTAPAPPATQEPSTVPAEPQTTG